MSSSSQTQNLNNFNSILSEYQDTYQQYLKIIDSSNNALMTVDNYAYNGGNTISQNQASNANDCLTSCQNTTSCTGATFDLSSKNCTLTSGKGNLISSSGSTAVIEQASYYSYKLQGLNNQLIELNKQLNNNLGQSYSGYQQDVEKQYKLEEAVQKNYNILEQERNQINQMIKQFETIQEATDNGEINVTMYYYNYIVLIFIAIILVILLIKFSVTGQQQRGGGGGNRFFNEAMFLLGIMIVFLGLSNIFNNLNGFIFVAILVIAYLIIKMKIMNS